MPGGSPSPPSGVNIQPDAASIYSTFKSSTLPSFNSFFNKQPLLAQSRSASELGLSQLPGVQSAYAGYGAPLKDIINAYDPIIKSGGAITDPGQLERLQQQSQAGFAARGNAYGNQSLGADLLNRSEAEQARLAQATSAVLGTTPEQQALTGASQAAVGQAVSPALATEQGAIGGYSSLVNPLFNLYDTAYNAQAASNIAASNQKGGAVGGGIGAIGSIAGPLIGL